MTRRIVEHLACTLDRETLTVVTVFEDGVSKQQARRMIPYSRRHAVLVNSGGQWEWQG